ncbi:MAG: erythromycin esterase family protein [Actinobacteria bacterium]|nr:erythromycin esterase family protein [Actinomycetota bacterium]
MLLGEATHGTEEFYVVRAEITARLIADHGFRGVAVEADWPAAARVNRYVRGLGIDATAEEALGDFVRFPRWMWRNRLVVQLVDWLREHGRGAGFYGLDLYSLRESMTAVVDYLEAVDPVAADRARHRYACFGGLDEREYGMAASSGDKDPCEDAVVAQLAEIRGRGAESDEAKDEDARFAAEQNARLAADAERYYRAIYRGGPAAWNLRDAHMADTLDALAAHLGGAGIVVWAHNSHVGDARATEAGRLLGEQTLGQLARQRHGDAVRLVGFTTHSGTVTAAREWGGPAERWELRPSREGSLERLLHDRGVGAGVVDLRAAGRLPEGELLERMVGVVYHPEAEIWSHYMNVSPAGQFDLVVHVDETTALEPLPAREWRPPGLRPASPTPARAAGGSGSAWFAAPRASGSPRCASRRAGREGGARPRCSPRPA